MLETLSPITNPRQTKNRKKTFIIIAAATLIVVSIIITLFLLPKPAEPEPIAPLENTPVTDISQLVNQTTSNQDDFHFSEVAIARAGAKNTVTAKLKYTGQAPASARVSFVLFNTVNNQLQGRKHEIIKDLQPGEERAITISIVGDFERSNVYKLEAEKQE
jgi:hypothetical protein